MCYIYIYIFFNFVEKTQYYPHNIDINLILPDNRLSQTWGHWLNSELDSVISGTALQLATC